MALFGAGVSYQGSTGNPADWDPNEVMKALILDNYTELDPAEPTGLDSRVYRRIEILKRLRKNPMLHKWDIENIDGILATYRDGSLGIEKGKVTYWYGGRMMMGPRLQLPPICEHIDLIDEYRGKFGPGHLWIEPRAPLQQRAAVAAFDSFDLSGHHGYNVKVQLIGQERSIIIPVLDDTGSSLLELLVEPDCIGLGFNMQYPHIIGPTQLWTANGGVERLSILVRAQVVTEDGKPLGPKIEIEASITPMTMAPVYYSRCSGRILQRTLYTATAPAYGGPLYVSTKKTGLMKILPAFK
ncbi:hypothetical protein AJ79_07669 [Helicocarpus griseus UAMH5409]|uniref:Uncharacterized protein n=1 Tax=Helicocarpus griseus UAMH5409 TaxID=1447875 RepID=A0A2B7X0B8_9EURO|nr:hypothetical protein AJ79_07669 [Helicocarpus griseus UAMH5409]